MTNNKQTWREEYKLRYVPNCGDDEVCIAFWKDNMDYIEKTLQEQREEVMPYIKDLNMMIFRLEPRNKELEDKIVELKDTLLERLKK